MNIIGPLRLYDTGIKLGAFSGAKLNAFVCAECGHTELIVRESEMDKVRMKIV
jgi:hypothetical protein